MRCEKSERWWCLTGLVCNGVPPCMKGPEPRGTYPERLDSLLSSIHHLFKASFPIDVATPPWLVKEVMPLRILVPRECKSSTSSKTFHTGFTMLRLISVDTVVSRIRQIAFLAPESSIKSRRRRRTRCISECLGRRSCPQTKPSNAIPFSPHV